ncbi:MAG: diaminopimelate epimerase [Candidatus Poribacteria bacterium]|nr:MAG: diaminopimelate epimerase [Candidatus Poribacteria bacterium]
MSIPFMKFSGAGNDFIIVDNRSLEIKPTPSFVQKVCARRLSVGADGFLMVEPPDDPKAANFKMRYFNADGGEVETCGNGARCIARFAYLNQIADEQMRFETLAGVYAAEVLGDRVKVQMSDPREVRLEFAVPLAEGEWTASFANTGVPHVVYFVEDPEAVDVVRLGRETRYHPLFAPAGTNANFVVVEASDRIRIRTYERGVEDETLACGTGAIASAVTAALLGRVRPPVTVRTAGGFLLRVHFRLENGRPREVYLEGDARLIYRGVLEPEAWNY